MAPTCACLPSRRPCPTGAWASPWRGAADLVLCFVVAAGYFAWSHGSLRAWGFGPAQQSEPQRMEQQIRPQSIRILRPEEARLERRLAVLLRDDRRVDLVRQIHGFQVFWLGLASFTACAAPATKIYDPGGAVLSVLRKLSYDAGEAVRIGTKEN